MWLGADRTVFELHQITPVVPCTSLKSQVIFYRGVLGFRLVFEAETYAFMRRDKVSIRLQEVRPGVDLGGPDRQQSVYIDVQGLDPLFESLKVPLGNLPKGRVRVPFAHEFGHREFHVRDEDCTTVIFGETETSKL